jgi:hypothetical protein
MLSKFSKYKLDQHKPVDQAAVSIRDYEYAITQSPHIVTLNFNIPTVKLYLTKVKGINRCIYEEISTSPLTSTLTSTLTLTLTACHRFSDEVFDADTVFVGYLMKDINMYMIEDILVHKQENISHYAIDKRLNIINTIVNQQYTPDPVLETIRITVKDYIEYEYLHSFYEDAITKPYATYINGLRFCPLNGGKQIILTDRTELPMYSPRSGSAAASQYEDRHTIISSPCIDKFVFLVRKTLKPDVYELYCFNSCKQLKYYDIACVPDIVTSKKVKTLLGRAKEAALICEFNREFGRWTPNALSNAPVNEWRLLST